MAKSGYNSHLQDRKDKDKQSCKLQAQKRTYKEGWILPDNEENVPSTQTYIDMEYMKDIATLDDITKAFQKTFILAANRKITPYEMNEFLKGFEKYAKHLHSYQIMEKYYDELKQYKNMYHKLSTDKKFDIKEFAD